MGCEEKRCEKALRAFSFQALFSRSLQERRGRAGEADTVRGLGRAEAGKGKNECVPGSVLIARKQVSSDH